MKLNQFNGGLNTRLSPNLIGLNESVMCNNVDLTSGTIKPLKALKPTNIVSVPLENDKITYFKGNYISGDLSTNFVEYNDSLYYSSGSTNLKKSSNGSDSYDVGINAPIETLAISTIFDIGFNLELYDNTDILTSLYANNLYLIAGASGKLATSLDGITWTQRTSSFGLLDNTIYSLCYGLGIYVAVGASGKLATSLDGITWTQRTSSFGNSTILKVAYLNGLFIAVGKNGKVATSSDGLLWTQRVSNFGTESILSITYHIDKYIIVGENGKVSTSTDGITWTSRTSNFGNYTIRDVYSNNTMVIAVGTSGKLISSLDGITWTSRLSNFNSATITNLLYTDKWIIVGTAGKLATSIDGITWTLGTSNFGNSTIYSILYDATKYTLAGSDSKLFSSIDLTNYTSLTSGFSATDTSSIPTGTYTYLVQYQTETGNIKYETKSFVYSGTKGIRLSITSMDGLNYVRLYRLYNSKYRLVGEATESNIIVDFKYNIETENSTTPYKEVLAPRTYVYTYYSSITKFESAPFEPSIELEVDTNNVTISNFFSSSDTSVDSIKIYRNGGSLTDYYLVDTVNDTVSMYIDTKSDLEVLDNNGLLTTLSYIKPPSGMLFLTEYNDALFGTKNSTLYFSNPGTVDNWDADNFITMPENITGLGATQNGLLIFSRNKTWILVGTQLSDYNKSLLNGSQGCVSGNSVAYISNMLLWVSIDGVCVSQGGDIELLSWKKLCKIAYTIYASCVYENQYYLFHSTGVLVVDFREGVRFYTLDLVARGAYYNPIFDKLYVLLDNVLGLQEFNSSTTDLTYKYKTGFLSDNGLTNYKTYKRLYIRVNGTSSLTVYINSASVSTIPLTNGFNDIMIPQSSTKGYYMELEFNGTGEILEVDFNSEGRQNGV